MAMVKEVSPIPPGRYWICVLGRDKQAAFVDWIRDMRGAVQVEHSSLNDEDPPTEFIIFNVPDGRSPFLNAWEFGYPNTAPPNITSLEDVEKTVEPKPDLLWNPGSLLPDLDGKAFLLVALALFLMLKR